MHNQTHSRRHYRNHENFAIKIYQLFDMCKAN